ncbi:MAG: hypothetical protein EZS28_054655 [Streblomastix strix]|uniref:Uncharacterized protein n=1 Tax=Streblomastix strix TaxID=222440 RepID=A0A5J4QJH6_9EUKA|nr:MAG: hypothetical protein EZS28_054655 [Streblomastix strix]
MLVAQVIIRSDAANQDSIGIINLLFAIQQLSRSRVMTKIYRQRKPSAICKQIMRLILNQNKNQVIEQNQETQISISYSGILPINSRPLGQPPAGQGPTGPYIPRNTARLQATISLLQ